MIDNYNGKFTKNAPLGQKSWFKCGGTADLLFEPYDIDDLSAFVKSYSAGNKFIVLGFMANCIIRDGGIRECVINLGKSFSNIDVQGTKITAGAGALNGSVAATAAKAGISGLEFLSGIPGTIGGALRMNAGAYGSEVKDVLCTAQLLDKNGALKHIDAKDLNMVYRNSFPPRGSVFIGATFEGKQENREIVRKRLQDIKYKRQTTQPISEKTGGSTFANPSAKDLEKVGLPTDISAWQLVEKAGGRDLQIGGARMSDKHLNFMINTGSATATDLENLGDELIKRVYDKHGLVLHWEIKRLGEKYSNLS